VAGVDGVGDDFGGALAHDLGQTFDNLGLGARGDDRVRGSDAILAGDVVEAGSGEHALVVGQRRVALEHARGELARLRLVVNQNRPGAIEFRASAWVASETGCRGHVWVIDVPNLIRSVTMAAAA